MRILFVHERFGAWAGAEVNLLVTARELRRRGHAVAILHGPGTRKGEDDWEETFTERFALATDDNSFLAVNTALERFQPDLAYVHKLADLDALTALVSSGVLLIRMVHDHELCCMRSYKYFYPGRQICTRPVSPFCVFPCGAVIARNRDGGFPLKWVGYASKKNEIRLNRKFQRLIVNSHYMREELVHNGFAPDRIELHPPVPPHHEPALHSSFSDRNLIVYAGQIVRGKGVDVLLESLALVRVPFVCVILGDGNHRPFCEQLSRKLGLADRVQFKGYVPPDQQRNYHRECSVVVVSSVWPEPFGMVGIEAMRHGLPVVAFDAGGIKEWLFDGQNGCLVPWMDRAAYAARVEELLKNKTLARQMGERGRQLVSEQYNFSKYISGLEDLFTRVAAETQNGVTA
ncbi:MAG TPA: glycosyltransferase family 4 protein [Candidatus Angelobacter sp.]|nr:glycosyltransferase family 4 protein [Candidatus Angelobacter sp.]